MSDSNKVKILISHDSLEDITNIRTGLYSPPKARVNRTRNTENFKNSIKSKLNNTDYNSGVDKSKSWQPPRPISVN
jgi:hypothetical protein